MATGYDEHLIPWLPVGKPIDPMARRVGVADETHGVWTAREESRGSPFLLVSTFRLQDLGL